MAMHANVKDSRLRNCASTIHPAHYSASTDQAGRRQLLFEAVLSVPAHKFRVRPACRMRGQDRASGRVDDGADTVWIVDLARHQNAHVVVETDEAPVEHPVRRPRQRHAVADDVGTVRFDRPDMGGFDLRAAVAVDQLQPGDGAAFMIRAYNDAAEHPVPH